tara:strand:+ start:100 stop:483 length:384 start_codon:yes stop_codon:yes gene_type:complete
MQARDVKKLYYSIGEVSEITGLKQYVLRYWETEFSQLRPSKNRAGNRTYRESDLNLINTIQTLLYKKKFTIKGARQYLKDNHANSITTDKVVQLTSKPSDLDIKTLKNLRNSLSDLIKILNESKKEL